MRRRNFIALLGSAAAWPLAARAQRPDKMPRIGVLMSFVENDAEAQSWIRAMVGRLNELGWTDGRNIHILYRWPGSNVARLEAFTKELIELRPDLLIAAGTPAANSLWRMTRSIPVILVQVADPVELGFVASLARPGGNITGFSNYELSIGGKWLQALKEVAPQITRVGVLVDQQNPSWTAYLHSVELAAPSFNLELSPSNVGSKEDIEGAIGGLARSSNVGLLVLPAPVTLLHRELIVKLSVRDRVPAVFPYRFFTEIGGLMSYSVDLIDMYQRAASYVDRILKGEKAADLPVQAPTKYELIINLKTARAFGLDVPSTLLARADEAIE
jgi:putative tryptophan/tyrosine transport system substrate-binding protein